MAKTNRFWLVPRYKLSLITNKWDLNETTEAVGTPFKRRRKLHPNAAGVILLDSVPFPSLYDSKWEGFPVLWMNRVWVDCLLNEVINKNLNDSIEMHAFCCRVVANVKYLLVTPWPGRWWMVVACLQQWSSERGLGLRMGWHKLTFDVDAFVEGWWTLS